MLTGVWPEKHSVVGNSMEGNRFDTYPHFFSRLKDCAPAMRTASVAQWAPLHTKLARLTDISTSYRTSVEVVDAARRMLSSGLADVMFVHIDDVDAAGHRHGYTPDSPDYLAAIAGVDGQIGTLLGEVEKRKEDNDEDWLVIVSTDHGGSATKPADAVKFRHGDDIPEHRTIFLIVSGSGVERGEMKQPSVSVDVPPTVLGHLGVAVRPEWGWEGKAVGIPLTPGLQ